MTALARRFPRDANGEVVQYPTAATGATVITADATSQQVPVGAGRLYRVGAAEDCWMRFGGALVVASATDSDLVPQGVEFFVAPSGATKLAIKAVADAGFVSVSEQLD